MKKIPLLLALAGTLLVVAVAVAIAAPDRTVTVSAAAPETAWDGPAAEGAYDPSPLADGYAPESCSKEPDHYCDITLVNIDSGGPVTVDATIGDYSDPLSDFDLYIYKSDSSGTVDPEGDAINPSYVDGGDSGWPNGFPESATVEGVEPGYYLVVVAYYDAANASYHGTFKVTGATPGAGGGTPTPTPTASATPAPSATPGPTTPAPAAGPLPFKAASTLGSAKKAKKSKKLAFKVTATESISNLQVFLLKGKKQLGKATVASFPAGTRKLTLKVSKKIKKGSYQLAARGTVNGQGRQVAQKVKVKK